MNKIKKMHKPRKERGVKPSRFQVFLNNLSRSFNLNELKKQVKLDHELNKSGLNKLSRIYSQTRQY